MILTRFVRSFEGRVFLLAVAVRLLFVLLYPGVNYYGGITGEYLDVTKNVLSGHGLTQFVDVAPVSSGTEDWQYMPFVARPIGYVAFFTLISLFAGLQPVAFQIVQAFVCGLGAVLVYRLVCELFEGHSAVRRLAQVAAVMAAVWPNQARFEIALLPDGPTTLIMLGLALALTRLAKRQQERYAVLAGVIVALSILLRPDLVLFPLFYVPVAFATLPRRLAAFAGVVMVGSLAIMIGLNTAKNYAISGEIVPLNLGSGTTMYEGISQFGDTLGTTYADERVARNKFDAKYLFYPDGPKKDKALFQEAIDTIKHHPGFYAQLVLKRIPLLFTVRGLFFSDTVSMMDPEQDLAKRFPDKYVEMFERRPVETVVRFASPGLGWLVIILGFAGLALALRRDHRPHLFLATLLLYFITSHLATNVEPRYFYPMVPLLYGYVAYVVLGSRRKDRREIATGIKAGKSFSASK